MSWFLSSFVDFCPLLSTYIELLTELSNFTTTLTKRMNFQKNDKSAYVHYGGTVNVLYDHISHENEMHVVQQFNMVIG